MILTLPLLLCLFFTEAAAHGNHARSICMEGGADGSVTHAEEKHCLSGTIYTWPRILTQGINKASSKQRREVPSWVPDLGR